MTFRAFTRNLGSQPGVQLNPLIDETEDGVNSGNTDQIFALVARLQRGRTDRPMMVTRNNYKTKTGVRAATIKANALNEAGIQMREGLYNGAYGAVVQRLVAANAARRYLVIKEGSGATLTATVTAGAVTAVAVTAGGTNYVTGQAIEFSGGGGTGAKGTVVADVSGVITSVVVSAGGSGYTTAPTVRMTDTISYSVSATVPTANFLMYLDHLGCWNDGIIVSLHADKTPVSGTAVANKLVRLRIQDPATKEVLYDVSGSLDPASVDVYGVSNHIADVLFQQTDGEFILTVAAGATIAPTSGIYGRTSAGADRWNTSTAKVIFIEGALTYSDDDLDSAVNKLRDANLPYGYIISGGTQSVSLIGKLANLSFNANIPLILDIPGKLTPDAASTFADNLSLDSHLVHVYYAPFEALETVGGYRETWGTGGLQAGLRCGRNARVNARGFGPKNYPVAGKDWPVNRQQIRQTQSLTDDVLSDLAQSRINPVGFEFYSAGGKYVFMDSLTSAAVTESYRKLISVSEMSSTIDNTVALYAKELIQLPMADALRRMDSFVERYLADAYASGWLQPSQNLAGGAPYSYTVSRSSSSPVDTMYIELWCSFDGIARQIIIQQRLVK